MIDIIMAVYNGEKYIRQQIDSILDQSFTEWKLIVRDDNSTDKTLIIVQEYAARYPGKIVLIQDNVKVMGAKYNFFQLMRASTSDYIMLADQDDVWQKDKVKHACEYIKKAEKAIGADKPVLCHSDLCVVDSRLNVISRSMAKMQKLDLSRGELKDYLVQNNVTGCTIIFNKCLRDMCRVMPEEAVMHDWWLALIASAFGRVCCMSHIDIMYRQHGHNTEGAKNLKSPVYLVRRLFSGGDVRRTLKCTYDQAQKFLEEYKESLSSKQSEIIRAYISLGSLKKCKKYKIIKKYRFTKSGLARKIGYIMFI